MRLVLCVSTALVLTCFAGVAAADPVEDAINTLELGPDSGSSCRSNCVESTSGEDTLLGLVLGPEAPSCKPNC